MITTFRPPIHYPVGKIIIIIILDESELVQVEPLLHASYHQKLNDINSI